MSSISYHLVKGLSTLCAFTLSCELMPGYTFGMGNMHKTSSKWNGVKLRTMRRVAGLTQAEFSKLMHADQSVVSRWERGEVVPDENHMARLCQYFDVCADFFMSLEAAQKEAWALREATAFRDVIGTHSGLRRVAIEELNALFGVTDDSLSERFSTNEAINTAIDLVLNEDDADEADIEDEPDNS